MSGHRPYPTQAPAASASDAVTAACQALIATFADPATAEKLLSAFRSVLGPQVPVRWGRKPRFLIPYFLVDAPVQGRTFSFPSGEKLQLMGGQFVAFGPHKDTGRPYEWENWDAEWPRITTASTPTNTCRSSYASRYLFTIFRRPRNRGAGRTCGSASANARRMASRAATPPCGTSDCSNKS